MGNELQGVDVDGLDRAAQRCQEGAAVAERVIQVMRGIVAALSALSFFAGPWVGAIIAFIEGTVIPWLERVAQALRSFGSALAQRAAAQRQISEGTAVDFSPLPALPGLTPSTPPAVANPTPGTVNQVPGGQVTPPPPGSGSGSGPVSDLPGTPPVAGPGGPAPVAPQPAIPDPAPLQSTGAAGSGSGGGGGGTGGGTGGGGTSAAPLPGLATAGDASVPVTAAAPTIPIVSALTPPTVGPMPTTPGRDGMSTGVIAGLAAAGGAVAGGGATYALMRRDPNDTDGSELLGSATVDAGAHRRPGTVTADDLADATAPPEPRRNPGGGTPGSHAGAST